MRVGMVALVSGLVLAAPAANAGTIAGTFDGFCDGFSLTTSSNGAASGVETGCVTGPIAGRWTKKFKGGSAGGGATTNEAHVANAVYEINTTSHTWAIYEPDGSILQTGTWTAAPPRKENMGLPATGMWRQY